MRDDGVNAIEIDALDKAAWHMLEAVKALRVHVSENRFDEDDPYAQYIDGKIAALQKLADKLSPPRAVWPAKVIPITPSRAWKT